MAARLIIVPGAMPSRDANGRTLPALFRFYVPGATVSTPKPVYTDASLTVAHPFPIPSDSAGRWPLMYAEEQEVFDVGWSDQVYDQAIKTFTGVRPALDATFSSVELAQAYAEEAAASAAAAEADRLLAEAAAAGISGAPFNATSASPNTIGLGPKTFILGQTTTLYQEGQTVVAAVDGSAVNQMTGIITDVDPTLNTLTIAMSALAAPGGVGPYSAWRISLSSSGGVLSVAGLSGIVTADALKAAAGITGEAIAFAIAL